MVKQETMQRDDLPLCMALAERMPIAADTAPQASGPKQESRIPWRTWVSTSPNDNDQANIDYHFD